MLFDPLLVTYILVGIVIILLVLVVHLEIKVRRLLVGKDSKSLEDSITSTKINLEKLNSFQKQVIIHLETVEKRLNRSIQAVETIRFNPFKGTGEGGNQSFSTVFVSGAGDGVVISSLYSRERVSIFSKPIHKFESSFELTEEEKELVKNSQNSLK